VQIELIDVLVDAGASPDGNPDNALVNANFAAAEHLVGRGATLTLATALCLGRASEASQLAKTASDREKQFAFVLAALRGKTEALKRMIGLGVDVNRPSDILYSHGTPLHHAVCSGALDAVQVLVEAGADLGTKDTAWQGTPLGWAEYYLQSEHDVKRYAAIAAYLREKGG
jgi:ankyrin repeat protein